LNKVKSRAETAVHIADINALRQLATTHAGDRQRFIAAVMTYLENRPGRGDVLESIYNEHVAPAGMLSTLGQLVHADFVRRLKDVTPGVPASRSGRTSPTSGTG
jgi:hypothetical protein